MRINLLTFILFTMTIICHAQTTITRYYKDEYLRKEVPQENAKYAQITIENADGSLTTTVKDIKKDEVRRSQTFKGQEPVGNWVYMSFNGPKPLDYSFPLNYSDHKCDDFNLNITDYFIDNEAIEYKAPQISTGEKTFNQFLARNIIYPGDAVRENIQGTVKLVFTITKEGNIENIYVQEGRNILLDKEAVRVVKKLKLSTPPTIKGQNQDLCVSMPVTFKLQ